MSEQDQPIKNFKTIIIGKSTVGKSTLLLRYVQGQFNPQKPTIGIDYRFKRINFQGQTFNLQLWDSAGQQRYRTIVYNYFNLSKAACVVFDITSQESLKDAKNWLEQFVLHCGKQIPKILIGNKCDLFTPQQLRQQLSVIKPSIDKLKQEFECQFFVVSAKTGQGVDEAFNYLIKKLVQINKSAQPQVKNTFKLNQQSNKSKDKKSQHKKCCQ